MTVKCPTCCATATLTRKRLTAKKPVGEYCDGSYGLRHPLAQMLPA